MKIYVYVTDSGGGVNITKKVKDLSCLVILHEDINNVFYSSGR